MALTLQFIGALTVVTASTWVTICILVHLTRKDA